MKRIISIGFVFLIVLNTLGYFGVFLGLHYRNDLAMSKALDADHYDESHAIILKVPVSIPYMPDQLNFERVNGKFEHEGELYRIVKQRYAKDTLTVVCVKDTEHKKIDMVLTDYVKTFTDKTDESKSATKSTISFLKDYLPIYFSINSGSAGWSLSVIHNSEYGNLFPSFSASIVHPPERV